MLLQPCCGLEAEGCGISRFLGKTQKLGLEGTEELRAMLAGGPLSWGTLSPWYWAGMTNRDLLGQKLRQRDPALPGVLPRAGVGWVWGAL